MPADWSHAIKTPVAATLIVIVTWVTVVIGVWILRKILFHGPLKSIDKKLGALFGGFKGVFLVLFGIIIIIISPLQKNLKGWINNSPVSSRIIDYVKPTVLKLKSKAIKRVSSIIQDQYDDFEKGEILSKNRDLLAKLANLPEIYIDSIQTALFEKISSKDRDSLIDFLSEKGISVSEENIKEILSELNKTTVTESRITVSPQLLPN